METYTTRERATHLEKELAGTLLKMIQATENDAGRREELKQYIAQYIADGEPDAAALQAATLLLDMAERNAPRETARRHRQQKISLVIYELEKEAHPETEKYTGIRDTRAEKEFYDDIAEMLEGADITKEQARAAARNLVSNSISIQPLKWPR